MKSLILVHPKFDGIWPWAADHLHQLWRAQGEVDFVRLSPDDARCLGEIVPTCRDYFRAAVLGVSVMKECIGKFSNLRELAVDGHRLTPEVEQAIQLAGIALHRHRSEALWGQSVAECALALTLCGLRRIPQLHHEILISHAPWDYRPPDGIGTVGQRGQQFGDDPHFTNGTVAGKRVRVVGVGNIGGRYAQWMKTLGADVAAWDPLAPEASFDLCGARREWDLMRLVRDAEIFAPHLPLRESTRGIITAEVIDALPRGCLVVIVTRMRICDTDALRRRVLADEIALAADVFDVEPLSLDDPLLGRHNVVHTPHIAGRTVHANHKWAEQLAAQFKPVQ